MKQEASTIKYNDYAFCWFPSFLVPPTEGGQEPPSEWLRVPINFLHDAPDGFPFTNRVTFPHIDLMQLCPVIILESDLTLIKWVGLGNGRRGAKLDPMLRTLLKDTWNTEEIRCKDCPEWPWVTLFNPEFLEFRIEETFNKPLTVAEATRTQMMGARELQDVLAYVI